MKTTTTTIVIIVAVLIATNAFADAKRLRGTETLECNCNAPSTLSNSNCGCNGSPIPTETKTCIMGQNERCDPDAGWNQAIDDFGRIKAETTAPLPLTECIPSIRGTDFIGNCHKIDTHQVPLLNGLPNGVGVAGTPNCDCRQNAPNPCECVPPNVMSVLAQQVAVNAQTEECKREASLAANAAAHGATVDASVMEDVCRPEADKEKNALAHGVTPVVPERSTPIATAGNPIALVNALANINASAIPVPNPHGAPEQHGANAESAKVEQSNPTLPSNAVKTEEKPQPINVTLPVQQNDIKAVELQEMKEQARLDEAKSALEDKKLTALKQEEEQVKREEAQAAHTASPEEEKKNEQKIENLKQEIAQEEVKAAVEKIEATREEELRDAAKYDYHYSQLQDTEAKINAAKATGDTQTAGQLQQSVDQLEGKLLKDIISKKNDAVNNEKAIEAKDELEADNLSEEMKEKEQEVAHDRLAHDPSKTLKDIEQLLYITREHEHQLHKLTEAKIGEKKAEVEGEKAIAEELERQMGDVQREIADDTAHNDKAKQQHDEAKLAELKKQHEDAIAMIKELDNTIETLEKEEEDEEQDEIEHIDRLEDEEKKLEEELKHEGEHEHEGEDEDEESSSEHGHHVTAHVSNTNGLHIDMDNLEF